MIEVKLNYEIAYCIFLIQREKDMQNNTSWVHLSKKEQSSKIPGGQKILVGMGELSTILFGSSTAERGLVWTSPSKLLINWI